MPFFYLKLFFLLLHLSVLFLMLLLNDFKYLTLFFNFINIQNQWLIYFNQLITFSFLIYLKSFVPLLNYLVLNPVQFRLVRFYFKQFQHYFHLQLLKFQHFTQLIIVVIQPFKNLQDLFLPFHILFQFLQLFYLRLLIFLFP